LPPATVLIPCKGVDAGFEANVEAFLRQEYPDYRIIFIVASEEDPAYSKIKRCLDASADRSKSRATLVVAGIADGRGEKVHNLLRGLESVDPATPILVFADIDATPHPDWLRSLATRLHDPQVTVSTGFRWYLPGKGFASLLRAAWDTSIATMLGERGVKFAWGGSMAIRAADFRRLRVAEDYWASSVSDDYGLTRAVNAAGEKIAFEPKCLVASREESSLGEFLSWSTRQIIITRVYASHLWKLGLAASILYCATFVMGFALLIWRGAGALPSLAVIAILLVVLILGGAKGYIRAIVAREMFPAELGGRSPFGYWLLSPLVPWVMLGNFLVAGFTRRIEWRGTVYELISPYRVRVVKRSTAPADNTPPGRA
jgi:cellulose synthase/poly-beta-1,6-N-acetylglucosamine synthase-like glycosyltransferase